MSLWNTTFDASTDWSAATFLNMFVAAVNERKAAAGDPSSSLLTAVAAGDDVQSSGFINAIQTYIYSTLSYTNPWFIDINKSLVTSLPSGAGPLGYTAASFSAASGVSYSGSSLLFHRKRPREIASTAATSDHSGNAAAPGQVAWLDGTADLYVCVSSGSWALASAGSVVDVLDSHSGTLTGGNIAAGDYIGMHLFNELRDALNVLTRLAWQPGTPAAFYREKTLTPNAGYTDSPYASKFAEGAGGSYVDWPGAEGDLNSTFPTATGNGGGDQAIYEGSNSSPVSGTPHWAADCINIKWSAGAQRFIWDIALTFTVKVYYIMTFDAGANTFDDNGVTDSGGSPITAGTHQMGSQLVNQGSVPTISGGLIYCYPLLGDYGTVSSPPNPCSAPPTNGSNSSGYRIDTSYHVEDYDVSGGFAYTVHT